MISENVVPQGQDGAGEYNVPKLSAKQEKEVEVYTTGLSKILHSSKTKEQILSALENGGDPMKTIPHLAMVVNSQMEDRMRQQGKPPSLEVLMNGGVFIVGDLVEMAKAVEVLPEDLPEDQQRMILETSMKAYIQQGLKAGTIDPIELQEKVNAMMPDDKREHLEGIAKENGYSAKPDQKTAMSVYGAQQRRKGMLQGQQQGGMRR